MRPEGQPDIEMLNEKLLVMRAQNRDEVAFCELVEKYERRLLYYIYRLLGSDMDRADVLQEIWMKVFLRINTLRAPEAFRVWIYKIAHDVAVSHLRKNKQHSTQAFDLEEAVDDSRDANWNELELLEDANRVHRALGKLTLPHREVLTLRFLEELDVADIAEVIGLPVGTIKSRLHHAKAAMRRILEANNGE